MNSASFSGKKRHIHNGSWARIRFTKRFACHMQIDQFVGDDRQGWVTGETWFALEPVVSDNDVCMESAVKKSINIAISLGCYRIQKPLKSGNTKKIRKNDKIAHFRFGPKNTKKLPKNYKIGQKMTIFVIFR